MQRIMDIILSTLTELDDELDVSFADESAWLDTVEVWLVSRDVDTRERMLEAIWHELTPDVQRMLSSAYRAEIAVRGEDIPRLEKKFGLKRGRLLSWCSGMSVDVPIGAMLGCLSEPLHFLSNSYNEGIEPLMSWSERQWEELHQSVRQALEPHSASSLSRSVPLTREVLKRIKSRLEPGDHFYEDFFTMKMLLDVYEAPQKEEERGMSEQMVSQPEQVGSRDPGDFVISRLVRALEVLGEHVLRREDVMLMMSRGRLHLWVGDLYVTSGKGVPERPDPVV